MSIIATLMTLSKGIDVANQVIDLCSGSDSSSNSHSNNAGIQQALDKVSSNLQEVIKASGRAIIDKIESDKLEELHSRIDNISMLLRIGKNREAFQYMLLLRESVDYANNRYKEGKLLWLPACIMGKAAVFAALEQHVGNAGHEKKELRYFVNRAKHELLDMVVPQLLSKGRKIPWDRVEVFLTGEGKQNPLQTEIQLLIETEQTSLPKPSAPKPSAQAAMIGGVEQILIGTVLAFTEIAKKTDRKNA